MQRNILNLLTIIVLSLFLAACTDNVERSKELVKLGKKKLSMGLNDKAMEYFEDAIRRDKNNHEAWYYRGSCKVSLGLPQEGIEDFSQAIELKEDFAPAWYNRGLAWFYMAEQEKACEDWKQAETLGYPNINDKTRHCR